MAQNFLTCDRDQPLLLPPDLRDWLPEDHLAWFVIEAIEELDLEPFYAAYRSDGHGAAAHEPKMMLTLLAYSYAVGERSSRAIERRCREDVAFRVICANQIPDHATIARFRVRHEQALADLFGQVLGLCADAGLVEVGRAGGRRVQARGLGLKPRHPKLRADRRRRSSPRRGASTPPRTSSTARPAATSSPSSSTTREGRRAWLREAKERLERRARRQARSRFRGSAQKRLELCRRRLVEDWRTERQANRDYEAYRARGVMRDGRRFGRPPGPAHAAR